MPVGNYWTTLDNADFDDLQKINALRLLSKRPRPAGKGKGFATWKSNMLNDKNWTPVNHWCYDCDCGWPGLAPGDLHGPTCSNCGSRNVEGVQDMRRQQCSQSLAPEGSRFWTHDMWEDYWDKIDALCDACTPSSE